MDRHWPLANGLTPNIQANACRITCTTSIDQPLDAKKSVGIFMRGSCEITPIRCTALNVKTCLPGTVSSSKQSSDVENMLAKLRQCKHRIAQTTVRQHRDNIKSKRNPILINRNAWKRQLFA
jgi:hypothetical protein